MWKAKKWTGAPSGEAGADLRDVKESWKGFEHYDEVLRSLQSVDLDSLLRVRKNISSFKSSPVIRLIVEVTTAVDLRAVGRSLASILEQSYIHFEVVILADHRIYSQAERVLLETIHHEPRVVLKRSVKSRGFATICQEIRDTQHEYATFVRAGDTLDPHALFMVAKHIQNCPHTNLIYFDEDIVSDSGIHCNPVFKPDWSPDYFYCDDYIGPHFVVRTAFMKSLLSGDRTVENPFGLILLCLEKTSAGGVTHIPHPLYHNLVRKEMVSASAHAKAQQSRLVALKSHFSAMNLVATVEPSRLHYGHFHVRHALPEPVPLVSLIIPTKNARDLVKQCIDSIYEKTTYTNFEIILVDNNSDEPESLAYFSQLESSGRVRIVRDSGEFNYSRINNTAVQHAEGEILCLLNNDIEVITPDWLEELVSYAQRPDVGAVGARLWYPSDQIQHAGVIVGFGGVAGHAFSSLPKGQGGYQNRAKTVQNYEAVTAACLAIRKDEFLGVSGFNEKELAVAFNDIDLCIRLTEKGLRNVWTPFAELYHHESATRGTDSSLEKQARFRGEVEYMKLRHGDALLDDRAYSPWFDLNSEAFTLAKSPRVRDSGRWVMGDILDRPDQAHPVAMTSDLHFMEGVEWIGSIDESKIIRGRFLFLRGWGVARDFSPTVSQIELLFASSEMSYRCSVEHQRRLDVKQQVFPEQDEGFEDCGFLANIDLRDLRDGTYKLGVHIHCALGGAYCWLTRTLVVTGDKVDFETD